MGIWIAKIYENLRSILWHPKHCSVKMLRSVYSSVPLHSYGRITTQSAFIRPYRDKRSGRITTCVNLICPYRPSMVRTTNPEVWPNSSVPTGNGERCARISFARFPGNMAALKVGEKFPDLKSLQDALKRYEERNNVVFIKQDSRRVEVANKRIKKPSERYPTSAEFATIHFACKHFGRRKTTSTGLRPNQA